MANRENCPECNIPLHYSIDSKQKNPYFPCCSSKCSSDFYTKREASDKRAREEHEARWHAEKARKKEEQKQESAKIQAEWERSPEGQKVKRRVEEERRKEKEEKSFAGGWGCAWQATAWISFCVLLYLGMILFNKGKVAQAAILMTFYVPIYFLGRSLFNNDK